MGKFCTNCGAQITEDQEKCSYCGKVLKAKVETPVQNTQSTQNANGGYEQNTNTYQAPAGQAVPGAKSKIAGGLLGIFLGCFGVHNFYLGYTGKAVAQLLITILSCGVLSFASGLWGLIEGIMILTGNIATDAQGNPLVD